MTRTARSTEKLLAAMRETLSPQAAAIVASACHAAAGNMRDTPEAREVTWFADELITMLGPDVYVALLDSACEGGK